MYTDGSGKFTQHRGAARAGWGFAASAASNSTHDALAYGALPTFTQSVGCAEIFAAAMAIRHAEPLQHLIIATDYDRLVKGWHKGLYAYTGPRSKCAEAWKVFWAQTTDFGVDYISVRKVPAHRPFADVGRGIITFSDWIGNQQADEMARLGADLHPDNAEVVAVETSNASRLKRSMQIPQLDQRSHAEQQAKPTLVRVPEDAATVQ